MMTTVKVKPASPFELRVRRLEMQMIRAKTDIAFIMGVGRKRVEEGSSRCPECGRRNIGK